MTQAGLTVPQQQAFDAILRHQASHGVTPTAAELRDALGLRSKSGVVRLLDALVERGYITKLPRRARSIAVVPPASPAATPPFTSRALQARLEAFCRFSGDTPEAVIHDAVALHLDEEEGAVTA